MILTENIKLTLEQLIENTLEAIESGLVNKEIADGVKKLGPRPKVQVPESTRAARKEALGRVIGGAGAPTTFYPGGKK